MNATDAQLNEIRALHYEMLAYHARGDLAGYFKFNQAIHLKIVKYSGNAVLYNTYRQLNGAMQRARYMANLSKERWMEAVREHETAITDYALERVAEVPGLRVFGPPRSVNRLGPVSFEIEGIHAHDVSEILDRHGVAVRAGHHCAQPLMDRLGIAATARASFGVYTTREEIDRLVEGLHDTRKVFGL